MNARASGVPRRAFLRQLAQGSTSTVFLPWIAARPLQDTPHPIEARKRIPSAWQQDLERAGPWPLVAAEELPAVAMPVSGIGTGQLYVLADGTLETWDIFNEHRFSGYGRRNYGAPVPRAGIAQGFGVFLDGRFRPLSKRGFAGVRFRGRYPLAEIEYTDEKLSLGIRMEVFSPFVPLSAKDSGLPATVFRVHLKNQGTKKLSLRLLSWLENATCRKSRDFPGHKRARLRTVPGGAAELLLSAEARPPRGGEIRPPLRLAGFDGASFEGWKAEGEALGPAPAHGTLPRQQQVTGFAGQGYLNSFHGGDDSLGTLTSPPFVIERRYLNFLLGGGSHEGRTCVELLMDGKVLRSASGKNSEKLEWRSWQLLELAGRTARIRVADRRKGPWGHVLADAFELADEPRDETRLESQADFGELLLRLPGEPDDFRFDLPPDPEDPRGFDAAGLDAAGRFKDPEQAREQRTDGLAARPVTGLGFDVTLAPGEAQDLAFVLGWHFPNHPYGRYYATRFHDARALSAHLGERLPELEARTRSFVACYYDSTLPPWLLGRILFPIANLATSLVQWRQSGRFWAWEGVGCCAGTCTHVWNYAQAMAALFPELERNVRELQDFGEGFDERTGLVGFRSNRSYAADGQCGTVLKAYREHLRSRDEAFLRRNWPRIRMALLYLVRRDRNRDGIIEDRQHNTYDISFYGANSFVGALYLAALRAGEEMAGRVGDQALAERLGRIFARGSELGMQRLFDGEYFIQDVDLEKHPKSQYGKGCLSDQLFGQNWARRLGLGYLYPEAAVRSALRAIYRYNWTADVGPYNARYEPERVFARPGEPGLFTCTWPKDPTTRAQHIEHGVRYRSEVWTGIEHQVASHMIGEGLLTQGLHILRGIEDRYDGRKSNPYNEVECGDHYARALASWSSLEALMGFELDGPRGRYVFAPRFRPEDFRAFFAGPAGFGSYAQQRDSASLRSTIRLRHGSLTIRELVLTAPLGAHACRARATLRVEASREALPDRARWTLRFAEPLVLDAERHPELEVVIA